MLLLLVLLTMAVLANSLTTVHLSGNGGLALLNGLTNSSENMTDANKTGINLSISGSSIPLSGNNGTTLLNNISKDPANLSFGSTPRSPPPPPIYDPQLEEEIAILRANHVGY